MEDQAASAAKKRSPWRHVVVPAVVALTLATFGQFVSVAAATNLKPRVAARHLVAEVVFGTSLPGAPDLTRASRSAGRNCASAYSYDAYGTAGPYATGTNPNPYGFAGERTDAGSGLEWNRARWYAPGQGRFLSRDALTNVPYSYSKANPVRYTDPSGNCGDWCEAAISVANSIANTISRVSTGVQVFVMTHSVGIVGFAEFVYGATTGDPTGAAAIGAPAASAASAGAGATKALPAAALSEQPWSGEIVSTVTTSETTAWRYWNGSEATRVGRWLSPRFYESAAEARSALSLPPENTASYVQLVRIPAGTRILYGRAAGAWGQAGGGAQIQLLYNLDRSMFGGGVPVPP